MIVEVFRKGYRFKERLLRPALVKVARRADDDTPQDESLH
jgi:molecular chaperone GrpE (heat shock protein)